MKIAAAIFFLATKVVHADFFRNDFLPVGHVRTDAIIDPDCLSDHVHTFYGPPLLYPKLTFEDLRNSHPSLSSGNIEENNSLYWHPAVYHVAADGTKTLQESEMTTVYYNWIPGNTAAFPPGFRMVTPGEDVFDEGTTPGASEMELNISFQSCWDGVNLDSADHMSHVAFPNGEEEDATCPSSHPVRIPKLDFFIRWFNTKSAKWRFSDGTVRFHADYVSGWDKDFLQSLLDGGDGDFDSKVTFRAGIRHQGDDQDLIRQMNENKVPDADTTCITTEPIDNLIDLPRGSCTGNLISPVGQCDGTAAPTSTPTTTPPTPTTSPPTPSGPTEAPTSPPTTPPTPPADEPTSPPTANPTDSPGDCSDGVYFFLKPRKRQACSWLASRPTKQKRNFCTKKWKYGKVGGVTYGPPMKECLATCNDVMDDDICDSCYQNDNKLRFFFKKNNKNKTLKKKCNFLNDRSESFKNRICDANAQDPSGVWPSVQEICPEVCLEDECS